MRADAFSAEVHRRLCAMKKAPGDDPVGLLLTIADQVATEFMRTNPAAIQAFIVYCRAQATKDKRRLRRGRL